MAKLKVYGLRDFSRSAHLPRDVLDALGASQQRQQGQVLVWATSARAAFEHLRALKLPCAYSAREIGLAMGYDVEILNAAFPWPDGTVLATTSFSTGPVVEIIRQAADDGDPPRRVRVIGALDKPQHAVFRPADPSVLVTDAMIEAAYAVLPGWLVHEIESQLMRDAIAAALRARDEDQP
jgi:hypothetical protein